MFTGIIESVGVIVESRVVASGRRLRIDGGELLSGCPTGASVAVGGVCLTVAETDGATVAFDVIHETLRRTTLGVRRPGNQVNLERSLRVGDRLDGHFVQGHVDGTARVIRVETTARDPVVWLTAEESVKPYLIPKGAVAVEGVSLTIASLEEDRFSVALIPVTLRRTTLSALRAGDAVNIETDVVARTVVHHLFSRDPAERGLSLGRFREAGFV